MKWYKLVFKQLQPIHIGTRGYGVISETRLFIPGWTMWGALTNTYGILNKWSSEDYKNEDNQKLFENITCFYPSFEPDGSKIMFPTFKYGEFYLREEKEKGEELSETEFRYQFVHTCISTAIHLEYLSAKEASLHEMEVILPKGRNGKKLCWVGLIGIDEDIIKEKRLDNFLKEGLKIKIGGDVRYGLGKLQLVKMMEAKEELKTWGISIDGKIESNNSPSKHYLLLNDYTTFKGKIELLVEFNFQKEPPELSTHKFYITPGSEVFLNKTTIEIKLVKGKGEIIHQ